MRWGRSVLAVLALIGAAVVLSYFLTRASSSVDQPAGSSESYRGDGTQALYQWVAALGGKPARLTSPAVDANAPPAMLFIVQPRLTINQASRRSFDQVAQRGGTIVIAADSFSIGAYLRALNVTPDPVVAATTGSTPDGSLTFPVDTRQRLRADGATPLLISSSGDWLALRKPYLNGSLVVIGTAGPLTNEALRNQDNARWVLRELLGPAQQGATVAFDEAHYVEQPQTDEEPSFETLMLTSAAGRALLFGVLVLFVYLVLAGRRLGPPLPPAESGRAARTMYEHVQALASLYRRARQFLYLRDHFERHYRRLVARSLGVEAAAAEPGRLTEELRLRGLTEEQAAQLATALDEVSRARRDRDLLDAVTHAEQAATALPHSSQERRLAGSSTR